MSDHWFDDPQLQAAALEGLAGNRGVPAEDRAAIGLQLLNTIGYQMAILLGEVQPGQDWEGSVAELAGRCFDRLARLDRQREQLLALAERHELPTPDGGRKDWSRIWPSEIREILNDEAPL